MLLQLKATKKSADADTTVDTNTTLVVFHKGTAKIVPASHKIEGESPRLAEPYQFRVVSLDTQTGQFKMKQYNRTHLSEMREMFEDIVQIKSNHSEVIMTGNGKLINKTGAGFESPAIHALIGKAIQKQYLPFQYTHSAAGTALQAQDPAKEPAKIALSLKQGKTEELPFDSPEVKKALEKKKGTAKLAQQQQGRKKDTNKTKDKDAFSQKCKEPELLVDSQDGSVLKICSNSKVQEWKSLALLGGVALNNGNKYQADYSHLFQSEAEIGLKLYSETGRGG